VRDAVFVVLARSDFTFDKNMASGLEPSRGLRDFAPRHDSVPLGTFLPLGRFGRFPPALGGEREAAVVLPGRGELLFGVFAGETVPLLK